MKNNEYMGDHKVRTMFEAVELIAAKTGDQDFDLEDIRFCLDCCRFYDANYWIATIALDHNVAFVCERCAEQFERYNDDYKQQRLDAIEVNYRFYRNELKSARVEASTR